MDQANAPEGGGIEEPDGQPAFAVPDWKTRFRQAAELEVAQARTDRPAEEPEPPPVRTQEAGVTGRTTPISSVPEVAPRRVARSLITLLLGLLFGLGVLATALLAHRAYEHPSQSSVALGAVVAFATAIVWAVRAAV